MAQQPRPMSLTSIPQRNVRRFESSVRSGRPHRKADRRQSQSRRIVHTISDHAYRAILVEQLLNRPDLVIGQHVSPGIINSNLAGYGQSRGRVVPREHNRRDTERMQLPDRLHARLANCVGDSDHRQGAGA